MHVLTRFAPALLAVAMAATPAAAGPAEVALLNEYTGNWSGTANLQGAEEGTISCRLTLSPNGDRVRFNGRCSLPGTGTFSPAGTIAYDDASNRYVAAVKSGRYAGRKSGNGVVFNMEDSNRFGTVNSAIQLSGGAVRVDFRLVDRDQAVTEASIVMRR